MCLKIKSGPRGIRTPDLLNAIETRSQLRYGPGLIVFSTALRAPNPPEGGYVRYGPRLIVFPTALRAPSPPEGGYVRYGPGLIVFPTALRAPSPPEGGCVRYGPGFTVVAWPAPVVLSIRCLPARDGPGGTRTLDLFSAIEARSQLRYRPDVNQNFRVKKFYLRGG